MITQQSCIVVNTTKDKDKVCYLHGIKMRKVIVRTQYGNAVPHNDLNSLNAKIKYPMGCVVPVWPSGRLALVYHCTKCDSIIHHSR